MSIHEAYEFYRNANVELEFDQFDHAEPEVASEAMTTNWDRFPEA